MKNILEYKRTLTIAGATLLAVSGTCWGYVIGSTEAEKEFEAKIDGVLAKEVDRIRNYYNLRYKDFGPQELSELNPDEIEGDVATTHQQFVIPQDAMSTPEGRAMIQEALSKMGQPAPDEPVVTVNGQDVAVETPYYDEQALINARSSDYPYVLSPEEYERNEAHYEQYALTWFAGDQVLLGADEDPIPDVESVIGDKNLEFFGAMGAVQNVVYVQNDLIETNFEITRSMGTAQEAVFGAPDADDEATIEHSSMRRRHPGRGNN